MSSKVTRYATLAGIAIVIGLGLGGIGAWYYKSLTPDIPLARAVAPKVVPGYVPTPVDKEAQDINNSLGLDSANTKRLDIATENVLVKEFTLKRPADMTFTQQSIGTSRLEQAGILKRGGVTIILGLLKKDVDVRTAAEMMAENVKNAKGDTATLSDTVKIAGMPCPGYFFTASLSEGDTDVNYFYVVMEGNASILILATKSNIEGIILLMQLAQQTHIRPTSY